MALGVAPLANAMHSPSIDQPLIYDGCTVADLESYVDSPEAAAYLIKAKGSICGFALLEEVEVENVTLWELADLFILPQYRGGWTALEAVRQIIAEVKQPMVASTFKENTQALRFFQVASKRIALESARELVEEDKPQFYSFVINEPPALRISA